MPGLDPIGVIFTAKDLASGTVGKLDRKFKTLDSTTDNTAASFTKNLKMMAGGLVAIGVGAAGLGILNAAGKKFGVLNTAIAEVGTLIEGTPEQIAMLTEQSKALSNAFGGGAKAQAAAFYQAISAGVGNVSDAQRFLTIANKVAIGGVTDATTAIDGLTTITNSFVDQGVSAEQAADALFVAMKAGKTTIAELSRSMSKAAPGAAALGIRFDELLGATSALTAAGVPTAEAFTGLKAVFTAFASKQAIAKGLGEKTAKAFDLQNLKAKGLRVTLMEVSDSVGGNIEKLTKLLGSSEAVNAVLALTGSQANKFADIMDGMANKTGEANAAFLKMADTTDFIEGRFDSLTESLVLSIGEAFDPIRKAVLKFGVAVMEAFNAIPQPIIDFLVRIIAVASAVIALVGAVVFLKAAFVIISILAIKFGAVLLPIIGIILGIVAAIGLMILLFKNNVGGIGDFFRDAFNDAKLFFQAIIGVISSGGISEELFNQLQDAGILGFVETVLSGFFKVKAFLGGLFDGLMAGMSIAMPSIELLMRMMKFGLTTVMEVLGDLVGGFVGLMGGTEDAGGAMTSMANIGKVIGVIFGTVIGIITSGIALIWSAILGVTNLLWLFIKALVMVGRKVAEVLGGVVGFFTNNKLIKFALSKIGLGDDEEDEKKKTDLSNGIPILPKRNVTGPKGEDIGIGNSATILQKQAAAAANNAGGIADVIKKGQGAGQDQKINIVTRVMIDENQIAEAVDNVNTKKRTANGGQN
ncbi:MAG: phage tail tape measure protein [Nitrosomonadaceae bacterium]